MRRLLKSFKTEINPTEEQKIKIHKTIGTCRYIYNFYLFHNKERYDAGERFMSGKSFSVWLNNEYLPGHPEYSWIREEMTGLFLRRDWSFVLQTDFNSLPASERVGAGRA